MSQEVSLSIDMVESLKMVDTMNSKHHHKWTLKLCPDPWVELVDTCEKCTPTLLSNEERYAILSKKLEEWTWASLDKKAIKQTISWSWVET